MPIPAGSKGGYWGPLTDTHATLGDFIQELPQYVLSARLSEVRTLGIYINSVCNLACAHCYYGVQNGYRGAGGLDEPALLDALNAVQASSLRLFAFVGKEVFLPGRNGIDKTLAAMRLLAESRTQGRELLIGAVTNGHFVHRGLSQLQEIELDFLDISFEGADPTTHDSIRGAGAFSKATRNLALCVREHAAKKVFVATTLLCSNRDTLANILDFNDAYGVQHYSLMPVVALQDREQGITLAELERFLAVQLPEKMTALHNKEPIQFSIDLDAYMVHRGLDFFERFFDGSTVHIDRLNNLILTRTFDNAELVVRISLPDPCNSYGCISHDGLYFDKGGCLFMKTGYESYALGDASAATLPSLLDQHRSNADHLLATYGADLFARCADEILNTFENTTFYALPQIS